MSTMFPVKAKKAGNRFSDDRPRADGFTDEEIGVPAADFRKGQGISDTDEWKLDEVWSEDQSDRVIREESIFDDVANIDESDFEVEESDFEIDDPSGKPRKAADN